MKTLYDPIEPFDHGMLAVSPVHTLYYEQCGNPLGQPVVFLHGGPGGGIIPDFRRYFDPRAYRIVLFDQRGSGKSTPHGCLEDNTTWHLVSDIERLREHLGIEAWQVFGGSWGSTLGLAYAETHPERVRQLVLRGIFLCRSKEIRWFLQEGASAIFPDLWEEYLKVIPENERGDILAAYHRRVTSEDEGAKLEAARALSIWEGSASKLLFDHELIKKFSEPQFALGVARIECHYFTNNVFFETENYLIDNIGKIRHIPAVIVQGRYDVVCPMENAWELHRAWPEAAFKIIPDAGHSATEPGTTSALIDATDSFREGQSALSSTKMRMETLAVHAGHAPDPATGAVTPTITLSTTFERDPDGTYPRGYFYSSKGNPNRSVLEECLADLEGGGTAVAFASGSAAITSVLRTLRPKDHVIVPNDMFQGTFRILRETLGLWEIEHTAVEMTNMDSIRAAVQPNTKVIWTETLSNPMLKIYDVGAISSIAHQIGALCVCDNSFVTPVFQQPLNVGADLVVHATTKYLGGHGDVVGGVVIARQNSKAIEQIRQLQILEGAVPSPFDCWLLLRGLRTLPYRMRAHAENAMRVASFLEQHPMVEVVHYPGLESHPQHEIAKRLLKMFGGMISVQVSDGKAAAMAVAANVRIFIRATSLGGTESLIEHRASSPIQGTGTGTPDNLLRLSIGLEHADDLIDDLAQALEAARSEQKEK